MRAEAYNAAVSPAASRGRLSGYSHLPAGRQFTASLLASERDCEESPLICSGRISEQIGVDLGSPSVPRWFTGTGTAALTLAFT